ncbi:CMRF35-like molecule 8 isoform X2 [Meriones unguiculatus]|uniref:CMRF35-like molecule 8 isoform X2 n=1 Tax=Meriones unguiculatus TaxID=10047 RepID=UPI000B4F5F96|nr:CMRF35-like molecule 8 isoform X2 [Meriones unguiculatus]
MTQLVSAVWLPTLLLLLFRLPGCVALRGPSTVTGTVGESLSVQCQYEEKYKTNNKYWCRRSFVPLCNDIVRTRGSEEARNGRVSIRDHPDNLTFTVTLENLDLEDAGTYICGVDKPFKPIDGDLGIDDSFKVVLSVVPNEVPGTDVVSTSLATKGSTQGFITVPTSLATKGSIQGSITEGHPDQRLGLSLPVLLSVLALLLLLLVGTSVLAWRMFQKRLVKADTNPELSQNLRQAAEQSECQYVNLQLRTWPLREEPVLPSQVEVEYSTVAFPQEELHYTLVAFDSQGQDSQAKGNPASLPQDQKAEYSEVRKPREGPSGPHL